MKLYVAGPMRGIPEFNFPAFFETSRILRALGHTVFNPAERDNDHHGTDISKGNTDGSEAQAAAEHGFSLRNALAADTTWISQQADGIVVLPGFSQSSGAKAEVALALALKLPVFRLAPSGTTYALEQIDLFVDVTDYRGAEL